MNKTAFAHEANAELQRMDMPDMHILLARLASGVDPRTPNNLRDLIMDVGENNKPTKTQWQSIYNEAKLQEHAQERVELDVSIDALKQLMRYGHAVPTI
jgi:hypothetical protein